MTSKHTSCNINTSINDMAKFVYGHTEVFLEISRRNCKEQQNKTLLNSRKFCCIGVLLVFHNCFPPFYRCSVSYALLCPSFSNFSINPIVFLCTIYRINLHQYYKINMRREIYVALGLRAGYHHRKVNVEDKKKFLCQLLLIEWKIAFRKLDEQGE